MKRFVYFLVCIFVVLPISAEESNHTHIVDKLFDKSGLSSQLKHLPLLLQTQITYEMDSSITFTSSQKQQLISSINDVFDSQAMAKSVKLFFLNNLTELEINKSLVWLNTKSGHNVVEAEKLSSSPDSIKDLRLYIENINVNPPTTIYIEKIERLASHTKAVENAVNRTISIQLAIATAMSKNLGNKSEVLVQLLTQEIEKNRDSIRQSVAPQVIVKMSYTYRTLSDSELEKYIAFTTTDYGKKYTSVLVAALNQVLIEGSGKLGEKMIDYLQGSPGA